MTLVKEIILYYIMESRKFRNNFKRFLIKEILKNIKNQQNLFEDYFADLNRKNKENICYSNEFNEEKHIEDFLIMILKNKTIFKEVFYEAVEDFKEH